MEGVCFAPANIHHWVTCSWASDSSSPVLPSLFAWMVGMLVALHSLAGALTAMASGRAQGFDIRLIDEVVHGAELPPIPQKFIDGTVNDGGESEALRRWKITYQWRQDNGIDTMLDKPMPNFDVIKRFYPHFWCGRARKGSICYYEKVGRVDLKAMKSAGVTVPQIINYYTYMTEYMWNVISPEPEGPASKCLTIFDVGGVSIFEVVGEVLEFIKGTSGIAGDHYPERCANILIINAPKIFSSIWSMISPMINPVTRDKVRISCAGEATTNEMMTLIDRDQLSRRVWRYVQALPGAEAENAACTRPKEKMFSEPCV
eukprot:FR734616.1.p1 GENE.FR734616.1~~FR734616.1.p1  ORF type:complete len:335 (+),score=31.49 FR734616.1:59-1006(+)